MRVRAQDENGDYTIGSGSANFLVDSTEFTQQMVGDYLGLFEGEWFLDITRGLPLFQDIVGYSNPATRDLVTKSRILETPSVNSIETFSSTTDAEVRDYEIQGSVQSQFSKTPVPIGPVVI